MSLVQFRVAAPFLKEPVKGSFFVWKYRIKFTILKFEEFNKYDIIQQMKIDFSINYNIPEKISPLITGHLKLKCLTLKIKNFKFASNLREDF